MTAFSSRRVGLLLALAAGVTPLLADAAVNKPADAATVQLKGKVVPLAELATKAGTKLDADAAPLALVLVAEDGKTYTLLKDGGARLFFKDAALLHRPMRLTGHLLPGSQILQVTAVHSYVKGELCEVYYWCDICSIRRGEKNVCECCGGPMELHEDPVKK